MKLVTELTNDADKYRVSIENLDCGATLIDAGLNGNGGFLAGKIVTEICLAGCGKANVALIKYGDLILPSVFVTTDFPALATLGSQAAGWQVNVEGFSSNGSGPARALAMEPFDLYQRLNFKEESDVVVLVLESDVEPPDSAVRLIAEKCGISAKNLFLVLFTASSVTGTIQGSGRVVEVGLRKLVEAGLDPLLVKHAWGYAPIVAPNPSSLNVKERMTGAIQSCGVSNYTVDCSDERHLRLVVSQSHATALKMIQEGKRLSEQNPRYKDLFKYTRIDLSKVDADTVAPAVVTLSSLKTGISFGAGKVDFESINRFL
jgi:methenyltetrahydromethanopterin cyclohydrolase